LKCEHILLEFKNTKIIMGIQDNMKEVYRTNTIHIGVWTRRSGAIIIFGAHSSCGRNYKYDRKRHSTRKVKSTYGAGRRNYSSRIPSRGGESKGQILA
jgi:hypothetical protein